MKNLTDVLAAPPSPRKPAGPGGEIRKWVATLPESEQASVMAAAVNPDWGHRALNQTLQQFGMPAVTDNTVRDWRVHIGWQSRG